MTASGRNTASPSSVDPAVSDRMRNVKRHDTAPEISLRKYLFSQGYRYRIHRRDLPGRPDVVFPGRRKVVFVHGCFWHGHEGCRKSRLPKTRTAYWRNKIANNVARDGRAITLLEEQGWRVLVAWECEIRRHGDFIDRLHSFLDEDE